jgi:hypothetical protein
VTQMTGPRRSVQRDRRDPVSGAPEPAGLPAPAARRLRPPSWRDRRLVVGVVLVLASVALGTLVVGRADDSRPVYAASRALLPGQPLTSGDLRVVRVRLGRPADRYLSAATSLPAGAVVIRGVQSGELVPMSALGTQQAITSRPVAVPVPSDTVDGLKAGALVDVWVARKSDDGRAFDQPTALVRGAEIVSVSRGSAVLASTTQTTVRVLVSDALVPQVLSAVDNDARIDVVPVPGSVPRGGS